MNQSANWRVQDSTLTAAELSTLCYQYMGDSMAICIYKYFLKIVENDEIKSILQSALRLAENQVQKISEFLKRANYTGFISNLIGDNLPIPRRWELKFCTSQ